MPLNPLQNVFLVPTAADLPDVLSQFVIYNLQYDAGAGIGLYYTSDGITLQRVYAQADGDFFIAVPDRFLILEGTTAKFDFDHSDNRFWIHDGNALKMSDLTDVDDVTFVHDGSDFNILATTTRDIEFANFTRNFDLRDGLTLRIRDPLDTDFADFAHNGVDFTTLFTNTTDWDISGLTTMRFVDNATGPAMWGTGGHRISINQAGQIGRIYTNSSAGNVVKISPVGSGNSVGQLELMSFGALADDASGSITLRRSLGLYIVVINTNAFAMFYANGTTLTVLHNINCSVGLTGTNPDVDVTLNIWKSTTLTLNIKNRLGSAFTPGVFQLTG